jgi:hypothetical protein
VPAALTLRQPGRPALPAPGSPWRACPLLSLADLLCQHLGPCGGPAPCSAWPTCFASTWVPVAGLPSAQPGRPALPAPGSLWRACPLLSLADLLCQHLGPRGGPALCSAWPTCFASTWVPVAGLPPAQPGRPALPAPGSPWRACPLLSLADLLCQHLGPCGGPAPCSAWPTCFASTWVPVAGLPSAQPGRPALPAPGSLWRACPLLSLADLLCQHLGPRGGPALCSAWPTCFASTWVPVAGLPPAQPGRPALPAPGSPWRACPLLSLADLLCQHLGPCGGPAPCSAWPTCFASTWVPVAGLPSAQPGRPALPAPGSLWRACPLLSLADLLCQHLGPRGGPALCSAWPTCFASTWVPVAGLPPAQPGRPALPAPGSPWRACPLLSLADLLCQHLGPCGGPAPCSAWPTCFASTWVPVAGLPSAQPGRPALPAPGSLWRACPLLSLADLLCQHLGPRGGPALCSAWPTCFASTWVPVAGLPPAQPGRPALPAPGSPWRACPLLSLADLLCQHLGPCGGPAPCSAWPTCFASTWVPVAGLPSAQPGRPALPAPGSLWRACPRGLCEEKCLK